MKQAGWFRHSVGGLAVEGVDDAGVHEAGDPAGRSMTRTALATWSSAVTVGTMTAMSHACMPSTRPLRLVRCPGAVMAVSVASGPGPLSLSGGHGLDHQVRHPTSGI